MSEEDCTEPRPDPLLKELLRDRSVFLHGPVDDASAAAICAQLLVLDEREEKEIRLFVNSPGGLVTAGLAILDTMRFVASPVRTIAMGTARSMGSLIVAAGEPGRRAALPNASFLVHQPSGGYQGSVADLERHAKDILATKARMIRLYVELCGRAPAEIERALDRDTILTAEEARDFGLVDEVVSSRAELSLAS